MLLCLATAHLSLRSVSSVHACAVPHGVSTWLTVETLGFSFTMVVICVLLLSYRLFILPRVDKQECATPHLSCTICRYPRPWRNFLLTSPFFRRTRILPQSSVRACAGHRPCSVKPAKSTRENFPKDSQRERRRKDYVNKKFRRGPTHPRVAHSCLSTFDTRPPFVNSLFNVLFFAKRYAGGRKKTKAHSNNWKPQSNILTSKACDMYNISGSNGTCRHRTTLFDGTLEHMPDESNKTGT